MDPCRSIDGEADETCWSDLEFCKNTKVSLINSRSCNVRSTILLRKYMYNDMHLTSKHMHNWYCYAKTAAEQAALELPKERKLDLVVINLPLVLGPLLQTVVNASTLHTAKYLDGSMQTYTNAAQAYVHVWDVADAHVRAYEMPNAHGQYLCAGRTLHRSEVCCILAKFFPEYPVPTRCKEGAGEMKKGCRFSSRRIMELGVGITPASQCLYDTVTSLQDKGILPRRHADMS
ncbi:hypothetical protein VPH35_081565 [Triticum aestivum]